jgi:hypothetical protein
MTNHDLILLKLSIQQALLREVTDQLVSVTCGLNERNIKGVKHEQARS